MPDVYEPSPAEIEAMTAEIRESWDEQTYRSRCTVGPVEWQVSGSDRDGVSIDKGE